jgi:cytochrome c556
LAVEPTRQVVRAGSQIEEGGTLTAQEIQALIAARRPEFLEHAKALDVAAREAISAIKARDADRLELVGGPIDDACEQCHLKFYYPAALAPQ